MELKEFYTNRRLSAFIGGQFILIRSCSVKLGNFLLIALALPLAIAQSQPAPSISYVASIKQNNSLDARTLSEYFPGGRLDATAITVRSLLRIAYPAQDYQLIGAPAWFTTKRYDIQAKADENPAPTQQALLRALLADRFNLAVHNETREMPTFALVLARSDGKLGPQLIKSDFDCTAYSAAPHPLPQPGRTSPCSARVNSGVISAKAIPLTQLATSLAFFANRFTADKTGQTGRFDIDLTWSLDDFTGPSLYTALQEQLGLKLQAEKGPVNVLVIDHASEPSAN